MKRKMTPMEKASSLANRRIPKDSPNRSTRMQDYMRGYEEGWNAARKPPPYPKPPREPRPGEYEQGLVPASSESA
jgi:hypothetical protein